MDFFALGKITKTRGLRGCLKVLSYAQEHSVFAGFDYVYIEYPAGKKNKYHINKIEISGKFLFFELQEVTDINAATPFIGCTVFVPKNMYPKLPQHEYYWEDIIGLNVFTEEGEFLGQIEAIFPTGSNDVYVCKKGKREILLPAVSQVIHQVNLKKGTMKVTLPKGL